jgi:phosphoribosylformylglycinamidine (FGAM) synthase-like amidotransferase family enzyme
MAGDTMTQEMICGKARMIYKNLKKNVAGCSTAEAEEEFKGSRGWFEKFKRRSGIRSVIRHGEGPSANKEEAEKFAREVQEWAIIHGYKPEQGNQERDKEDKECSSEEDSNKKGRMPTGDIKKMLHNWEEFVFGYKVASQQS